MKSQPRKPKLRPLRLERKILPDRFQVPSLIKPETARQGVLQLRAREFAELRLFWRLELVCLERVSLRRSYVTNAPMKTDWARH